MAVNLGSFEFSVDANASAAQRKIEAFVQAAQQGAKQVEQAFAGINITGGTIRPKVDTREVEAGVEKVARAAKQLADRPSVITLRANFSDAEQGFERLATRARELGNARLNLAVNATGTRDAEVAITRLSAALKLAKAGESINLNIQATSADNADAALRRLTADINAAKAAGARVNVNVQTGTSASQSFFQQARGGFIQQVTPGLATGAAAAAGIVAAQAVVAFGDAIKENIQAGIQYNAMLESASAQFKVFTGSAEESEEALKRLRRFADVTPFNTEEVIRSGQVFARVTGGNIALMERFVQLAGQLGATNQGPEGGIGGGTRAIQEALSGDFTSARERFNIGTGEIQRIKDAGLSGVALAEALVKAAHGSDELVKAMGETFTGRLTTAQASIANLQAAATKPLFDLLSKELERFNAEMQANGPAWEAWAKDVGGGIASVVAAAARGAEALNNVGNAVAYVLSLPNKAGLAIHEALGGAPSAGPAVLGLPAPGATGTMASAGSLSPAAQAHQDAVAAAGAQVIAAQAALGKQKVALEDNKKELERIQTAAKEVTAEYERQLAPLEAQQRALNAAQRVSDTVQRDIAQRQADAGPSVGARAQAAAQTAALDHEQALVEIRHRRAELSEQIAKAEEQAATRGIEAQIRGQEQALQALQARVQAENQARAEALDGQREEARTAQEARQTALEGTREEARGRQEVRQTALDGLRDLISAQQEQRRDALEGIQDEIRARRQQYDDRRTATQELSRLDHEAFEDTQHDNELVHQQYQQDIQDRLDGLRALGQEAERQQRRKSDAERELAAFNASQTEIGRQRQLDDARRAIGQARTGRELRAASLSYSRTVQDVAAERHRDELQARIAREKEASDKRREQIQDKITKLEQKARADDREYQRVRQANEEEERQRVRNEQLADRAAEKAERELRRQEDDRVREQQRKDRDADKADQQTLREQQIADREADRKDQAEIRAQEKTDREATRKEQAAIRAQEQADREADRKAQREILGIQQGIAAARNALADRKDAFETVLDDAALARLRESADIEQRRLDILERQLAAADPARLAQASADKVFADALDRTLANQRAANDAEIAARKARLEAALAPVKADESDLEIAIGKGKAAVEDLEKRVDEAKARLSELNGPLPGSHLPGAGLGPPLSESLGGGAAPAAGNGPAPTTQSGPLPGLTPGLFGIPTSLQQIVDGLSSFFAQDTKAQQAVTDWSLKSVAAFEDAWQIASPSKVTTDGAYWVAEGFIQQLDYQQPRIQDAVTSAFSLDGLGDTLAAGFQSAWEAASPTLDATITEVALRFGGTDAIDLPAQLAAQAPAVGAAEADLFQQAWAQGGAPKIDDVLDEIGKRWATIDDQIDNARNRQAVQNAIERLFGPNVLGPAFAYAERNFEVYGNNSAVAYIDGWNAQMSKWQPYVPAAQSGGNTGYSNGGYSGGAYSAASDGYASGAPAASMSSGLKGQIERYVASLGYSASDVQRYGALMLRDYDLLSDAEKARIAQYAQGTNYVPNDQLAFLHRGEAVIPAALNRPAGSVMPPGLMGSGVAVAAGVGGGWSGGGAPQVHFHFEKDAVTVTSTGDWGAVDRGMLEERLQRHGNEVMDDLVDILHASQRHAPRRSDRDLGGAR